MRFSQQKKQLQITEIKLPQCNNSKGVSAAKLFFTCFLLLSLAAPFFTVIAGEPVGWNDLGLYGGQINTIAIDPVNPNTMFVGSWNGDGLFRSINGGATWSTVEGFRNDDVMSISFDPGNHRTVWMAEWSRIYKSEDGGLTWRNWFLSDRYFKSLAIDPLNSNTIYFGTTGPGGSDDDGLVYKTTDEGETWQATALVADHAVVDIAVSPQNSNEIWAVTHSDYPSKGTI